MFYKDEVLVIFLFWGTMIFCLYCCCFIGSVFNPIDRCQSSAKVVGLAELGR